MNNDKTIMSGDPLHLGARLGTLEQEVSGLKTDINYIRQQIGELSHSFAQFISSSRTNWGVLAAWSTVILAIVLFFSKLTSVPYDNFMVLTEQRHQRTQTALTDNVQDKKELFEYSITNAIKLEYLEKNLEQLRTDIDQRSAWTKEDHREYAQFIEQQIQNLMKQNNNIP